MNQDAPHAQRVSHPGFRLFVGLFCAFCFSNLMLSIRLSNADFPSGLEFLLMGFASGAVVTQAALHAIWTVFGAGNRTRRLLVSVLTALVLYGALCVGFLFDSGQSFTDMSLMLLSLPLLLLAVQAPLWILKAGWRWGLFRPEADASSTPIHALSIQDLLLTTVVTAAAIALTRYGMTIDGAAVGLELLTGMFLIPLIAAVVSLLTVVPTLLATFRFQNMALGVWAVLTFEATIYVVWFAAMCILAGAPPPEAFALYSGLFIGFAVSFHAPLCYLRRCGYRLGRPDLVPTNKAT